MRPCRSSLMTSGLSSQSSSFRTPNTSLWFSVCWRYWALSTRVARVFGFIFVSTQPDTFMHWCVLFLRSLTFTYAGPGWSCWPLSWRTRGSRSRGLFWSAPWVSVSSAHVTCLELSGVYSPSVLYQHISILLLRAPVLSGTVGNSQQMIVRLSDSIFLLLLNVLCFRSTSI